MRWKPDIGRNFPESYLKGPDLAKSVLVV
jgi:hypothetical protein